MKYLSKLLFHISLVIAFFVGSVAYWSALGILALFIWSIAILYSVIYRLIKASTAFFQVLLTNPVKKVRIPQMTVEGVFYEKIQKIIT